MESHQEHEPRPRLDQRAALEELERFGRDIQRYREQREALGEQFETFVRSFRTPPPTAAPEPAATTPAAPTLTPDPAAGEPTAPAAATLPLVVEPAESAPAEPPIVTAIEQPQAEATPVFESPSTELSPPAMAAPPSPILAPAGRPRAKTPVGAIAAGAALLAGGALVAAFVLNRSPAPASEPNASPDTTAAAPTAAPTPAPTPAPAPTPTPAPAPAAAAAPVATASGASEIVTERKVWMRVIVDGTRLFEREVPAGTKIPLNAEKTIVIRTGDAGAVRLSIRGGAATLLGREGEVVTRSFTVPPRSEAAR